MDFFRPIKVGDRYKNLATGVIYTVDIIDPTSVAMISDNNGFCEVKTKDLHREFKRIK